MISPIAVLQNSSVAVVVVPDSPGIGGGGSLRTTIMLGGTSGGGATACFWCSTSIILSLSVSTGGTVSDAGFRPFLAGGGFFPAFSASGGGGFAWSFLPISSGGITLNWIFPLDAAAHLGVGTVIVIGAELPLVDIASGGMTMNCRLPVVRLPVFFGGAAFFVFLPPTGPFFSSSSDDEEDDGPASADPDDDDDDDEAEELLVYLVLPFDNGRSIANVTLGLAGLVAFFVFFATGTALPPVFLPPFFLLVSESSMRARLHQTV